MAAPRRRFDPYAKPRNDAYVGLLGISFAALLGGTVLLYLDYNEYQDQQPPAMPNLAPADPTPGLTPPGGPPGGGTGLGRLPAATDEPTLASGTVTEPIEPDPFHRVSFDTPASDGDPDAGSALDDFSGSTPD